MHISSLILFPPVLTRLSEKYQKLNSNGQIKINQDTKPKNNKNII